MPRKSNLKISSKGEIRLEDVSGDVELSGGEESINVATVMVRSGLRLGRDEFVSLVLKAKWSRKQPKE